MNNETDNRDGYLYITGTRGYSAYEVAVQNGFSGTEQEWLDSLIGPQGPQGIDGKSSYEVAVDNGYEGTEEEWLSEFLTPEGYILRKDIVDNLESNSNQKPLSANQGKELNSKIETTNSEILSTKNNLENQIEQEQILREAKDANLESQINSLSSGSPLVASSVSGMTDTTKVYVNTTDGKWYYYNGSSWIAGGTYQATAIEDKSITHSKMTSNRIEKNFNIVDWRELTEGGYYRASSDGSLAPGPSSSGLNYYSDYIPVEPNTKYRRKRCMSNTILYDENKTKIVSVGGLEPTNFTTPANCYYMRCSVGFVMGTETYDLTQFEISKDLNDDTVLPFKYSIDDLYINHNIFLQYRCTPTIGGIAVNWDTNKIILKRCANCRIVCDNETYILKNTDTNLNDFELLDFSDIVTDSNIVYILWDKRQQELKCVTVNSTTNMLYYENSLILGYISRRYRAFYINGVGSSESLFKNNHVYYRPASLDESITYYIDDKTINLHIPAGKMYFNNKSNDYSTINFSTSQDFTMSSSTKLMFNTQSLSLYLSPLSTDIDDINDGNDILLLLNVDGHFVDGYLLPYLTKQELDKIKLETNSYKNYTGEAINLKTTKYKLTSIPNYGQGSCVYNKKMFTFNNAGNFKVYDLESSSLSEMYTLEKESGYEVGPHANAVCFGKEFYSNEDTYPLLYVNCYNNSPLPTGRCYVYRLVENKDEFTNTLVQIIQIGFTDQSIWIDPNTPSQKNKYGNFIVDYDNNYLYVFTNRNSNVDGTEGLTRFFKFNLPTLNDGNLITLQESDIIEYFDIPLIPAIQDGCYYDNKIYICNGMESASIYQGKASINVIDLTKKENVSNINVSDLIDEPEAIYINENKLYTGLAKFYEFTF